MPCLTPFDLDRQVGEAIALGATEPLDAIVDPGQEIPRLVVETLERRLQVAAIEHEQPIGVDVPETFGMRAQGLLASGPDVLHDVDRHLAYVRVTRSLAHSVQVRRADPTE